MQLIDKAALLPNGVYFVNADDPMRSLDILLERIANAPVVDAVPVVRCKDCHWWRHINKRNGCGICTHETFSIDDCTVSVPTEKGEAMTDKEKLALIKRLVANLDPHTFTDDKMAVGVAHALSVAIECVVDVKDGDSE